jgi:hypothetical protein
MPSIGSVSCDYIHSARATRNKKQHVVVWPIPGIDGVGVHILGKSKAWSAFELILLGTSAEVETWIAAVEALGPTLVTVTDDWETEFTNFAVVFVGEPQKEAASRPGTNIEARCSIIVEGQIAV